MHIWISESD